MTSRSVFYQLSRLFQALSQPARLAILLAIGDGEACVCHLESALKMRQAYLSQQLMALREAGILATRREGRFIFYRLKNPQMLDLIRQAAQLLAIPAAQVAMSSAERPHPGCCCPMCAPESADSLIEHQLSESGN
jgi:ArsR family transcriptional regulator